MTDAGAGARGDSLPSATAGRLAEPVLPFPPRFRPRRGGRRPCGPRGPRASRRGAAPFRTADAPDPRRPRRLARGLRLRYARAWCAAASWWTARRSPAAAGGPIPACAKRRARMPVGALPAARPSQSYGSSGDNIKFALGVTGTIALQSALPRTANSPGPRRPRLLAPASADAIRKESRSGRHRTPKLNRSIGPFRRQPANPWACPIPCRGMRCDPHDQSRRPSGRPIQSSGWSPPARHRAAAEKCKTAL
jgi:hypothetical protein